MATATRKIEMGFYWNGDRLGIPWDDSYLESNSSTTWMLQTSNTTNGSPIDTWTDNLEMRFDLSVGWVTTTSGTAGVARIRTSGGATLINIEYDKNNNEFQCSHTAVVGAAFQAPVDCELGRRVYIRYRYDSTNGHRMQWADQTSGVALSGSPTWENMKQLGDDSGSPATISSPDELQIGQGQSVTYPDGIRVHEFLGYQGATPALDVHVDVDNVPAPIGSTQTFDDEETEEWTLETSSNVTRRDTDWVDVTSDALVSGRTRIRVGRFDDLDVVGAGTASFTLANRARNYEPDYSSSPYHPWVAPLCPVRIRAVWNTVTYDLFTGFVRTLTPTYGAPGPTVDAEVRVECVDAFGVFANVLVGPPWRNAVGDLEPLAFWLLTEETGTDALDSGKFLLDLTYEDSPTLSSSTGIFTGRATIDETVNFLGADDQAIITDPPDVAADTLNDGTFTFLAWVSILPENLPDATNDDWGLFSISEAGTNADGTHFMLNIGGSGLESSIQPTIRRLETGTQTLNQASTPTRNWLTINRSRSGLTLNQVGYLVGFSMDVPNDAWAVHLDGWKDSGTNVNIGTASVSDAGIRLGAVNYGPSVDYGVVWMHGAALFNRLLPDDTITYLSKLTHGHTAETDTNTQIERLLEDIRWPAIRNSLTNGDVTGATRGFQDDASALDAIKSITETEGGYVYVRPDGTIRFENRDYRSGASTVWNMAHDTNYRFSRLETEFPVSRIVNDVTITNVDSDGAQETVRSFDEASAVKYGRRRNRSNRTYASTTAGMQTYADSIVTDRAEPQLIVRRLQIKPDRFPSELWPCVLTETNLSQQVTVKYEPVAGSSVTKTGFIESVEHEFTAKEWTTTWTVLAS